MTGYVALLRAVNVGGTGKLPMRKLVGICEAAGFTHVRTYIASGNVVFRTNQTEEDVRLALERELHAYARKHIGVIVRSATEIAEVLDRNPFGDAPRNHVLALFAPGLIAKDVIDGVTGIKNEQIGLGRRELYVYYPDGMAETRLRIPIQKHGTARNMNTVAKLVEMTGVLT